jgi:hypothetical protein
MLLLFWEFWSMEQEQTIDRLTLESQLQSGAGWFIWIAGLSLVTSILWHVGSGMGFMFGLGITQVIDGFALAASEDVATPMIKVIALVLDVMVAGIFALFGVFAKKEQQWAFIVGMLLYVLDALIFLLVRDFLSLGVHAFALFCIFKGFKACRELNRMSDNEVTDVLVAETYLPLEQADDNIYSQ